MFFSPTLSAVENPHGHIKRSGQQDFGAAFAGDAQIPELVELQVSAFGADAAHEVTAARQENGPPPGRIGGGGGDRLPDRLAVVGRTRLLLRRTPSH